MTKIDLTDDRALEISEDSLDIIGKLLKGLKGFNLRCYKEKCIRRRISIRIRATHCKNAEEYCELLLQNESELELLLKVLTIHVSQFFRNPPTFQKLEKEVIPKLLHRCRQRKADRLRLWSVGCATGEEPYSLAMMLKEHFRDRLEGLEVSILATDVDAATLQTATAGIYGEDRLAEVPLSTKTRFFEQRGEKFHVLPEIKEMVTFRQADLYHLDSYEESNLILCRNVLIYFERSQQQKILEGFARVLHPGGFLVLGKSETVFGASRERFTTVCPVERIYRGPDDAPPSPL